MRKGTLIDKILGLATNMKLWFERGRDEQEVRAAKRDRLFVGIALFFLGMIGTLPLLL